MPDDIAEEAVVLGDVYVHRKTGHHYKVLGVCVIERDIVPAVRYARVDAEAAVTEWVRPLDEFLDGRFRRLYREV